MDYHVRDQKRDESGTSLVPSSPPPVPDLSEAQVSRSGIMKKMIVWGTIGAMTMLAFRNREEIGDHVVAPVAGAAGELFSSFVKNGPRKELMPMDVANELYRISDMVCCGPVKEDLDKLIEKINSGAAFERDEFSVVTKRLEKSISERIAYLARDDNRELAENLKASTLRLGKALKAYDNDPEDEMAIKSIQYETRILNQGAPKLFQAVMIASPLTARDFKAKLDLEKDDHARGVELAVGMEGQYSSAVTLLQRAKTDLSALQLEQKGL